jgi:anti-anti-sigma factor
MHIDVEHSENHATLHLRGEFDTYYVRNLQEEIDALVEGGVARIILNLRLVKFINSTALGAIIKASKALNARGGKLVIARPSAFCREIIEKVGLNRVVPIFDSDEAAVQGLSGPTPKPAAAGDGLSDLDESSVLFAPTDPARIEHFLSITGRAKAAGPSAASAFGSNWSGVGRMSSLDETGLRYTWSGGSTGLDPFAMGQLLAIGTEVRVKFRLPLFKPGWCEAVATVSEVEERTDGVKVGAAFSKIDDKTIAAVRQYSADLRFLKDELRRATGK